MQKNQRGFTLIELSIVLVILGLLVGGVLTGQSLIRAAELRSVTTQEQRYIAALQTFRDKYFALPGDMTNATAYWGTATCDLTTPSTTATTCNGDGNGQINWLGATSNESFRLWQHLANAGLIEGNYDGITHGSTAYSGTAANSPASRISSAYWHTMYRGTASGTADVFNGQYGNEISLGKLAVNTIPYAPIMKPEEIYNIDTKMDDGKPATGSVVLYGYGTVTNCTDAADNAVMTGNYLLSSQAVACSIIFRQAF